MRFAPGFRGESHTVELVVGVGARSGVPAAELGAAIDAVLAAAAVPAGRVTTLATSERRAAEAGVREVAGRHGWRLAGYPAEALAAQPVPHPSAVVAAAVGTASVAEAAALLAAGAGAVLLAPKRAVGRVTVAVAGRAG